MSIDYDDLITGEVYFGRVGLKTHYFFTYLGEGAWSSGRSNLYNNKSNVFYPPNTNKVVPIYRVTTFPSGSWSAGEAALHNGFNIFDASEPVKPIDKPKVVVEKVLYKVINVPRTNNSQAVFKTM